jgi:hypothetical protein
MYLSVERLVLAAFFVAGLRLWRLYLTRLDTREAEGTTAKRMAIAASRQRARGHLWALGVVMATLFVVGLLFGVDHPPLEPKTVVLVLALALADAFFLHKALAAYGDARRMRETLG